MGLLTIVRSALTDAFAAGRTGLELAIDPKRALWTRDYQSQPAQAGAAVTPSDSTTLTGVRALYIGATGDVAIVGQDDVSFMLVGVQGGTLLPIAAKKVKSTGTTATSIVALT